MKTLFALALCIGALTATHARADDLSAAQSQITARRYLPPVPGLPGLPRVPDLRPLTCVAQNANGVPFFATGYDRARSIGERALASCRLGSFGVACRIVGCHR
jgi:hypothetical protein